MIQKFLTLKKAPKMRPLSIDNTSKVMVLGTSKDMAKVTEHDPVISVQPLST